MLEPQLVDELRSCARNIVTSSRRRRARIHHTQLPPSYPIITQIVNSIIPILQLQSHVCDKHYALEAMNSEATNYAQAKQLLLAPAKYILNL